MPEQKEEKEERAAPPQADSKPTPTQDENDSAAMGDHVMQKEPDGSPEEESPAMQLQKQEEARKERMGKSKQSEARPTQSGYQTRASQAQPQHRPPPPRSTSGE
jgi:hypothetical protein